MEKVSRVLAENSSSHDLTTHCQKQRNLSYQLLGKVSNWESRTKKVPERGVIRLREALWSLTDNSKIEFLWRILALIPGLSSTVSESIAPISNAPKSRVCYCRSSVSALHIVAPRSKCFRNDLQPNSAWFSTKVKTVRIFDFLSWIQSSYDFHQGDSSDFKKNNHWLQIRRCGKVEYLSYPRWELFNWDSVSIYFNVGWHELVSTITVSLRLCRSSWESFSHYRNHEGFFQLAWRASFDLLSSTRWTPERCSKKRKLDVQRKVCSDKSRLTGC